MSGNVAPKPFDGLKIVDFTQVLAGPYATFQYALLGADVIKVERREGEDLRFMSGGRNDKTRRWADLGMMPTWQAVNGGKRSLTLDLQKPQAVDLVKRLVAEADVVVENFRPGVMDKLGIGYDALSRINPRLVYCSISAFGQTGPYRSSRGYDGKIQAMSGIMAMTGHESSGPTRAGFALCDVLAGLTAAFGIAAALIQRGVSGRGQLVDVSMLEAALAFLSGPIAEFTVTGLTSSLLGNRPFTLSPTSDLFPTADGQLLLAVVNERQFAGLMKAIGRTDLVQDERFQDADRRLRHQAPLREAIVEALSKKSALEWEVIIDAAGAPCACLRRLEEVLDHPQLASRGALHEIDSVFGRLRFAGTGFQIGEANGQLKSMAPKLGEHNVEILEGLGLTSADIADLRQQSVI